MSIRVDDVTEGHRESEAFNFFGRYSQAWIELMKKYRSKIMNDWPFYSGERPLTGFLSSAVWTENGVALEEYRADKSKREAGKRKDKIYRGRGDLYVLHGEWEGNIEFKRRYIGVTIPRDYSDCIKACWSDTEEDAKKYDNSEDKIQRLGGIFFKPYIGAKKDKDQVTANLKILIKNIWDSIEPDVLVWWCPEQAFVEAEKEWEIGVIMAIKRVD